MKRLLLTAGCLAVVGGIIALLLTDEPVPVTVELDEELTECVTCGTQAIWRDGKPINPGPEEAPAFCINAGDQRRRRVHGPFIPVIHLT